MHKKLCLTCFWGTLLMSISKAPRPQKLAYEPRGQHASAWLSWEALPRVPRAGSRRAATSTQQRGPCCPSRLPPFATSQQWNGSLRRDPRMTNCMPNARWELKVPAYTTLPNLSACQQAVCVNKCTYQTISRCLFNMHCFRLRYSFLVLLISASVKLMPTPQLPFSCI